MIGLYFFEGHLNGQEFSRFLAENLSDSVSSAVSWNSSKQRTVALSTTEAQYMGLSEATKEAIYLQSLIAELLDTAEQPVVLGCDNQDALNFVKNPGYHKRSIDIRHHFVRDIYSKGLIDLQYVKSEVMPADVVTKSLGNDRHCKMLALLELRDSND